MAYYSSCITSVEYLGKVVSQSPAQPQPHPCDVSSRRINNMVILLPLLTYNPFQYANSFYDKHALDVCVCERVKISPLAEPQFGFKTL